MTNEPEPGAHARELAARADRVLASDPVEVAADRAADAVRTCPGCR